MVGLALFPIAYHVFEAVNTYGAYSNKVNEEQIRKQAVLYLSRLSSEQAHPYEEYFSKISSMVALLAGQTRGLCSGDQAHSTTLVHPVVLHFQEDNQMFVSGDSDPVLSLYWGEDSLTPEIRSELSLLGSLDSLLIQVKENSILWLPGKRCYNQR